MSTHIGNFCVSLPMCVLACLTPFFLHRQSADGLPGKVLDPAEVIAPEVGSEEDSSDVSRQEGYEESAHLDGGLGDILDLLAKRAEYFTEDAMEFILSAIDSSVDERAVRRMIAMDEGELLRICGEVG